MKKNIVIIEWVDSVRASDWTYVEDVDEKPMDCISIGFLMKETNNSVTIAQNYGLEPEQVCNLMTIPKRSIKSVREIKEECTWKPSNEQIDALEMAVSTMQNTTIESLYKELKKLSEE